MNAGCSGWRTSTYLAVSVRMGLNVAHWRKQRPATPRTALSCCTLLRVGRLLTGWLDLLCHLHGLVLAIRWLRHHLLFSAVLVTAAHAVMPMRTWRRFLSLHIRSVLDTCSCRTCSGVPLCCAGGQRAITGDIHKVVAFWTVCYTPWRLLWLVTCSSLCCWNACLRACMPAWRRVRLYCWPLASAILLSCLGGEQYDSVPSMPVCRAALALPSTNAGWLLRGGTYTNDVALKIP